MESACGLIQSLEQTQGDPWAQAAVTAEFLLMTRPESEREALRDALDAAAVLRWFDAKLLGGVLQISDEKAHHRFEALNTFSFVERYSSGESELRNVHESIRLGWRKNLAGQDPERFRNLSARAASCFAGDNTHKGHIEWIYHSLSG